MNGKNNTISQEDFFLLEEVTDEDAEVISGGQEVVLGLIQEIGFNVVETPFLPFILPLETLGILLETIETAAGLPAELAAVSGTLGLPVPDPATILPV